METAIIKDTIEAAQIKYGLSKHGFGKLYKLWKTWHVGIPITRDYELRFGKGRRM